MTPPYLSVLGGGTFGGLDYVFTLEARKYGNRSQRLYLLLQRTCGEINRKNEKDEAEGQGHPHKNRYIYIYIYTYIGSANARQRQSYKGIKKTVTQQFSHPPR